MRWKRPGSSIFTEDLSVSISYIKTSYIKTHVLPQFLTVSKTCVSFFILRNFKL